MGAKTVMPGPYNHGQSISLMLLECGVQIDDDVKRSKFSKTSLSHVSSKVWICPPTIAASTAIKIC